MDSARPLFVCLLIQIALFALSNGASWSYAGADGPNKWKVNNTDCGKDKQSPVDIKNIEYKDLKTFSMTNYSENLALTVVNNGHAIQANIDEGDTQATIMGGSLPGTFKAAQFHFHWGQNDSVGSEHFINGTAYPMEIHIVHYNTERQDLTTALNAPNGLAVLGIMVEVGGTDNAKMAKIITKVEALTSPNAAEQNIAAFMLNDLLPSNTELFYRYNGSLTTPPCYETVTWTVFKNTISISDAQMTKFRAVTDKGGKVISNYRPIQPIGTRKIYSSDTKDKGSNTTGGANFIEPLVSLILLLSISVLL